MNIIITLKVDTKKTQASLKVALEHVPYRFPWGHGVNVSLHNNTAQRCGRSWEDPTVWSYISSPNPTSPFPPLRPPRCLPALDSISTVFFLFPHLQFLFREQPSSPFTHRNFYFCEHLPTSFRAQVDTHLRPERTGQL